MELLNFGPKIKALLGGLTAAAAAGTAGLQDGHMSTLEWVALVGGFIVGYAGVYFADNLRAFAYAKTLAALLSSLAAGILAAWADRVFTAEEVTGLLIAVIGSFVVSQASNSVASDGPIPEDVVVDPALVEEYTQAEEPQPPNFDDGSQLS